MIDIKSAWEELREQVENCKRCELCSTRSKIVLGDGPTDSKVVIIGEAPGQEEDESGIPFVGRAGQLLTKILENGGGIKRSSIYIMNTIKCRPPINRDPKPEEIFACREFLERQLLLIHPEIIVTMGNIPTKAILNTNQGITSMRGKWIKWRGVEVFPMFHPSYLLRNESRAAGSPKDLTWQDVRALKAKIDDINKIYDGS